jgi:hypothetical protein
MTSYTEIKRSFESTISYPIAGIPAYAYICMFITTLSLATITYYESTSSSSAMSKLPMFNTEEKEPVQEQKQEQNEEQNEEENRQGRQEGGRKQKKKYPYKSSLKKKGGVHSDKPNKRKNTVKWFL